MARHTTLQSPVAIGGVGGSGTRAISEILIKTGFYMGSDLNPAKDNLWFTILFKRPTWILKNLNNPDNIKQALTVFEKLMTQDKINPFGSIYIIKAGASMSIFNHKKMSDLGRALPVRTTLNMLLPKKVKVSDYIGWGWKEPNSHIILPHICKHFKNLKYIHTIRHGLDMAYSENIEQVCNWGTLFGITTPKNRKSSDFPGAALSYWIEANKRAVKIGKELLGRNFLLVNFDEMCKNPKATVEQLLAFLEIKADPQKIKDLSEIIKTPSSIGRYKVNDLSIFGIKDLEEVKSLGFEVEISPL